jgi:hypothetical protein
MGTATETPESVLSATAWSYKITGAQTECGRMDFPKQHGFVLTGTLFPAGGQAPLSATVSGDMVTVSSTVTFPPNFPFTDQWTFTGTVNTTVTAMDGSATRIETRQDGLSRTDSYVWIATRPEPQACGL